jgi:hypothetical protein
MKISEVLKRAKAHMRTNRFVCNAISDCDIPYQDKQNAQRYIINLLEHRLTAENWLVEKGMISPQAISKENMRIYRLRWIDHMINELERDGK